MCDENITVTRLKKLIDSSGKTRKEIAEKLNCDTSTITKHYNGDRDITTDFVIKYAKYFNVSADYLLGLLREATTDVNMKYMCDYLGLNEDAIKNLSKNNKFIGGKTPIEDERFLQDVHNLFFTDMAYGKIIGYLRAYIFSLSIEDIYLDIPNELTSLSETKADKIKLLEINEQYNEIKEKQDVVLYRMAAVLNDFAKSIKKEIFEDLESKEKEFEKKLFKLLGGD